MDLSELPNEIVSLIAEKLEFQWFLIFCATCKKLRHLFGTKKLIWLLQNFPKCDTTAIQDLHYISRSHILLYRFLSDGICDLNILIENGASFKYIPCGDSLKKLRTPKVLLQDSALLPEIPYDNIEFLLPEIPYDNIKFLLQHGASLHEIPYEINQLVENVFRSEGPGPKLDFLLQNGGSLCDVPCGINQLVRNVFRSEGPGPKLDFLL